MQLLSTMPKITTRCHDTVVCGYHVYMDRLEPAVGDKFNAEIEENIPQPIHSGNTSVKRHCWECYILAESIGKKAVQCLLGHLIINHLFDGPGVDSRGG